MIGTGFIHSLLGEETALDVLEKHPLGPGDEWLRFDNVIFAPHYGRRQG